MGCHGRAGGRLFVFWLMFALSFPSIVPADETRYTYDDLGRLVRVERPDGAVVTYTYDAVGNRLSRSIINDGDFDGVRDTLDCAPLDPGAHTAPGEVTGVSFQADTVTLSWDSAADSAGSDTIYDVAKGVLGELPAGTGSSEACILPGGSAPAATDFSFPAVGTGYWYLIRARNVCGTGTYGADSSAGERSTAACP